MHHLIQVNDTLYKKFLEAGRVPIYAFPTPEEKKCDECIDEDEMDLEPPAKKERKDKGCTNDECVCSDCNCRDCKCA